MGSFLDKDISFNPYISEAPADALSSVGILKQGQYRQGLEKVQGEFDQIAGLPIAKSETKDYIQGRLSDLRSHLNTSITGDFSDGRLINQIGGLAGKIAGDPVVQNGVQSTARAQAGLKDIEEAKKEGKGRWAPENEWDFTSKYQSWLNDKDIHSSFSGEYTPYTDLNKKWLEVVKTLKPDGSLNDIPFETYTNADGSIGINYKKLASVMIKRGVNGISPEKIENALRATLTPEDYNQLAISGNYQFRGATPQDLVHAAGDKYQQNKTYVEHQLDQAQKELVASRGDAKKSADLLETINGYKNMLGQNGEKGSLRQQLEEEAEAIQKNPDQAKTELYKNGFINQFSHAFSFKETKQEYTESPFTKVIQWNKEFALQIHTSNRADAEFSWRKNQDLIHNAEWAQEFGLKLKKEGGDGSGNLINELGVKTDIPSPAQAMSTEAANLGNNIDQSLRDLQKRLGGIGNSQLQTQIADYQKGNKNAFPADVRPVVDQMIKDKNDAAIIQGVIDKAKKQAQGEIYGNNPTAEDLLKGRRSLQISQAGKTYTFSPKEVLSYLNKEKSEAFPSIDLGTGGGGSSTKRTIDHNALSDKERALYETVKKRYGLDKNSTGDPLVDKYISDFTPVKTQTDKNEGAVNDRVNELLLPKASTWVPKLEGITTDKKENRVGMERFAGQVLTRLNTDQGNNKGSNLSDLTSWLKDDKVRDDLVYMRFNQGNQKQLWVKHGSEIAKINLSEQEASQVPDASLIDPQVMRTQKALYLGEGSTNPTGLPENAHFQQSDFSNAKKLRITADLNQELHGSNVFLQFHLYTPNGWKTVQIDKPLDIKQAQSYIHNATDQDILHDLTNSLNSTGQGQVAEELKKLKD